MIGLDPFAVHQLNTDGSLTIHQDLLNACSKTQAAAMFFKSSHQGCHHRGTASPGVVKAGLGVKPFAEQRGHRRGIGVGHRHAADQETQQVHPVPEKRVLQMTIHQRPESTTEMTQRRQVRKQLSTATQQRAQTIQPPGG